MKVFRNKRFIFIFKHLTSLCFLLFSISIYAQDSIKTTIDTVAKKKQFLPEGLLILPAVSYSPETEFTIGAAILYNFTLGKDKSIRQSNARLLTIYTSLKQTIIEGRWDLFTKHENYIIRGRTFYHKYPDRNYGLGNNASAFIQAYKNQHPKAKEFNYIDYETKRLHFSFTFMRKLLKNLYGGLDYEFESLYDYRNLNSYMIVHTPELFNNPVIGKRSGLGAIFTYDTRDHTINTYKGYSIELRNRNYTKFLGSDFEFSSLDLDFRMFFTTWKKQVFAFNFRSQNKFAKTVEEIPIRALARMGGADFVKGYFFGTYQDLNLMAFQSEYRIPIVKFPKFPIKGLGAALLFNGGRAFNGFDEFSLKNIRFTLGGGLRILMDAEDRVNIGLDYSFGLHKKSDLNKAQSGFYFTIGETF